jgi:hypothetical protein
VFRPREGDTVVLSSDAPPPRRLRRGPALAYAAAATCALLIGSFAVAPSSSPRDLAARALALVNHSGPASGPARVRFTTDQRLRVAIDAAAPVAVEPNDERELVPGRHHLVFEWPSGAHAAVDVELAAGEQRSVRPERSSGDEAPTAP